MHKQGKNTQAAHRDPFSAVAAAMGEAFDEEGLKHARLDQTGDAVRFRVSLGDKSTEIAITGIEAATFASPGFGPLRVRYKAREAKEALAATESQAP